MATSSTAIVRQARQPLSVKRLGLWILAVVTVILVLLPLAYMASASITPESMVEIWPLLPWPKRLSSENFNYLVKASDVFIGRWYINSILISGAVTALVVAISAITAYGFARLQFPGRDFLFYICLSTLMVPFQATLLPIYLMMRNTQLLNTYWAVILPPLASVFGTFLLRQFFLAFPRELEEAAICDGAGKFTVFWRILLPNSSSALTAVAIITFLTVWNDVFWPLIALSDPQMYTLPIGLSLLNQEYYGTPGPGVGMAAGVLGSVPILIFFFIFQRRIVEGIALTGLKG
ncbi:MAG: putative transporter permease protein [Chloroflexi bacterium]|nr:putative transporter permease protein [Chloroflexota bacterium]